MAILILKTTMYGAPVFAGSLAISYEVTKEKVFKTLNHQGYITEEIPDGAWEKVFTKFKGLGDLKDEDFKKLNEESKATSPTKTKDDLKKLCEEKFQVTYKSVFKSYDEIVEDTKKSCFIPLKDSLEANDYETDNSKLDHDKLKNYSESDPELKSPLKEIKTDLGSSDQSKKTAAEKSHADWCSEKASSQYLGIDHEVYKLFTKICKKKTST